MRILLITARDPLHAADGARPVRMATELAGQDHQVVLVLLEDAVALGRLDHRLAGHLRAALDAGVQIMAEEEALARRAVHRRGAEVKPADLGEVTDLIMDWAERCAWL